MIAGGAGGGALLLAAVAFFMYRRRSKRQSDGELPRFSDIKPQAAAPVLAPAPLLMTPSVRTNLTFSPCNAGDTSHSEICAGLIQRTLMWLRTQGLMHTASFIVWRALTTHRNSAGFQLQPTGG